MRRSRYHHQLRPVIQEEGRAGRQEVPGHGLRRVPLPQELQITTLQGTARAGSDFFH